MPGQEAKMTEQPRPRLPIRRFDVFAEYNKLKWLSEGHPLDEAKGYGLWLAKVVASRRFGPSPKEKAPPGKGRQPEEVGAPHARFRSLNGQLQTDELFDREIIERMGADFYRDVFVPAIASAYAEGKRYEATRDVIRKAWK
jgi:hypothetical protein